MNWHSLLMNTSRLLPTCMRDKQEDSATRRIARGAIVIGLMIVAEVCVYLTGGTQYAFPHLMYFPIVLAAFFWEFPGAAITALVGGIAIALMPMNVSAGIPQSTVGWLSRTIFFVVIGLMAAYLFFKLRKYKESEIRQSLSHINTGLPNLNKLKIDMDALIEQQRPFTLVAFRMVNGMDIRRFLDFDTEGKTVQKAVSLLARHFGDARVYSIFTEEFAVLLPEYNLQTAQITAQDFVSEFIRPVEVEGLHVKVSINSGIVHYPIHGQTTGELIRKAEIALNQRYPACGMFIYDTQTEQAGRLRYEMVLALYKALERDEFTLVYQPKISLRENRVSGLEALLRWSSNGCAVSPDTFIRVAEDIGMISDITRWVFRHTLEQMQAWQREGYAVRVSMNISARDLGDPSMMTYLLACIEDCGIRPELVELELTEGMVMDNKAMAMTLLQVAHAHGISVTLDDYGKGYHTLTNLAELPMETVKIDKYVIDRITEEKYQILLGGLIASAHQLGKKVTAEGVEQPEQVEALRQIDCDTIQGFFYSKPLPPCEARAYAQSLCG